MTEDTSPSILKLHKQKTSLYLRTASTFVAKATGKRSFRQAREIAGVALGRQKLTVEDYYLLGLWRPSLSPEDKAAFVSDAGSTAINVQLSPINRASLYGLLGDKLLTGLVLRAAGFPMQEPRAIFGKVVGLPGVTKLETAAQIAEWLRREGTLPVFGKPLHGSLSIGAASFLALEDGGQSLRLGNGTTVSVDAITREIAANFPRGYLFEPLIRQHPDVEAMTGPAVGALRVVTLRVPDGAEVLYTIQRLPAVGAMVDAASGKNAYTTAHIDAATGRVIRAQNMYRMASSSLETSPVTGIRFDAVTLPLMKEAQDLAVAVHRLLVRPGVLGFDIALTPDGPLINEVNGNPFHMIFQHAADRGLMNPEFKPRIEAAIAVARAELTAI